MKDEHTLAEHNETTIRRLTEYVRKNKEDGTLTLEIGVNEAQSMLGVDPVTFADYKRSLEETNRRIKNKVIDPSDIGIDCQAAVIVV